MAGSNKLDPTVPDRRGGKVGKPRGNPHVRDEEVAKKVKLLRALGNGAPTIALAVDLSTDTILRHYRPELEQGEIEANAQVGAAIFNSAIGEKSPCPLCQRTGVVSGKLCTGCRGSGQVWVREPNTTAQIWWSKNRMQWTDQQRIEHTGAGGGPILTEQVDSGTAVRRKLDAIKSRLKPANDGGVQAITGSESDSASGS